MPPTAPILLFWGFDLRFDFLLQEYQEFRNSINRPVNPVVIRAFDKPGGLSTRSGILFSRTPIKGIYQEEPEELNRLLSILLKRLESSGTIPDFLTLGLKTYKISWNPPDLVHQILHAWQQDIDIQFFGFTNLYLDTSIKADILGQSPELTAFFDARATHYTLFAKGGIPLPEHRIYNNYWELMQGIPADIQHWTNVYVALNHSAGGFLSDILSIDGRRYGEKLKAYPERLHEPFIVTRYIPNVKSHSCHGFIDKQGHIHIYMIAEMIIDKLSFLGFRYPGQISGELRSRISVLSVQAAELMADAGYRGYFGLDYIVDGEETIFLTELNPRYTFSTLLLPALLEENFFRQQHLWNMTSCPASLNTIDRELCLPQKGEWTLKKLRRGEKKMKIADMGQFLNQNVCTFMEIYTDEKLLLGSYVGIEGCFNVFP